MQPLLQWKKQWALHILNMCVCNLRYPACKAHAPYCHPWPVRFYNIFPHYLINGTIFGKKLLNTKFVFRFSFCLKYLMLRNERDKIKKYIGLHVMYSLLLSDLYENFNFRNRFSQNIQIWNFVKIRLVGAELFHADEQTERHDEANSRFS